MLTNSEAQTITADIQRAFSGMAVVDLAALPDEQEVEGHLRQTLKNKTVHLELADQERISTEFFELGPLENLLNRNGITEIIVNGKNSIWFEEDGRLHPHPDVFLSDLTYRNAIRRLCRQSESQVTLDHPYASGVWKNYRIQIVGPPLSKDYILTLRHHPEVPWTLASLTKHGWCTESQAGVLREIISARKNFLIVGQTGAGKTSVLGACLKELAENERTVIMEDTDELPVPNTSSTKLLTRIDPQNLLPPVDLSSLLRHSLRLRPDRLVLGEVRGPEAKDLMLSLATGHSGSLGTLHAQSAPEALLRLEMLIQLGAPQWQPNTVRSLIHLSLHYIVVAQKTPQGQRRLEGVYKLTSLEEFGFLVEKVG